MIKKMVVLLSILTSLYSKVIIDSRVIGGAKLESIEGKEYVVSLQHLQYGQYNAFCGGALIDETHIITAAHCITDDDIYVFANYHITPGGQQIAQIEEGKAPGGPIKGVIKAVSRVFKNRDFGKKGPASADIAVLEISEPIKISNYLQLPTVGLTDPLLAKNQSVELLGWGLESHTSKMPSNKLKSITIKTLTPQQCKNELNTSLEGAGGINPSRNADPFAALSVDDVICAGGEKVGQADQGSCAGDSGGPLVYSNGSESILIGVVSSGASATCTGKKAGNYAKVEKFLNFIRDARRGAYVAEGALRLGDIQALPVGFNLVGTQKEITAQSKIISKDVKTIYVYSALKRKWKTYIIKDGVLPTDFNIPPKYGFWLYK